MINTNYFHKKLEEERIKLEEELQGIGRINPENPDDWEPVPETSGEISEDPDPNVAADAVEDFENNSAVEVVLETRLYFVKEALKRIEQGKYGICKECGEEIEVDRLEANPAAITCKTHIDKEPQS